MDCHEVLTVWGFKRCYTTYFFNFEAESTKTKLHKHLTNKNNDMKRM